MKSRTHEESFAANPLALLSGAFASGILAGLYPPVSLSLSIFLAALFSLLAVTALIRRKLRIALALVVLSTVFIGSALASIERVSVTANQLGRLIGEPATASGEDHIGIGEPVELTGILERDPEVAWERWYLFLRVERLRLRSAERQVSGEVVLLAPIVGAETQQEFEQLDLRYGARIRVMTSLDRSDNFRNPGVSSFTEYLDRKGYDATGFIKSPLLIERLENQRVFLPLAWLYEWRRKLQAEIDSRFDRDTAGVLDAAMLGNRYNLSRSTSERFREGGTFHVLVISGLHITFLGGLCFLIAKRLSKKRAVQIAFPVVTLWAYSIAVGAEPSVLRAALMFTVVLLAPLVSRRASSLNALGGVGIALLAWHPKDLLDPSFQLTFVSVLAIVTLAWPLLQKLAEVGSWRPTRATPYPPSCSSWLKGFCESLYWSERQAQRELESANYKYKLFKAPLATTFERLHLQRLMSYGFGAVVVSLCVQVVLLPFLVIYFHRLSLASFTLNIGVGVLMAGVAVTAAAGLLIAQVSSTLAGPFISGANALNSLMVHSVDPFTRVGAASIRLPAYTGWGRMIYVLYYLPLTSLVLMLARWRPLELPRHKIRRLWVALLGQAVALTMVLFHPFSAGPPAGKLRVDFLDVGQGDSALVTFPDNTTLLIDGGGRPGPFQNDKLYPEFADSGEPTFERDARSIGESVVSEYLWWRGLDHVDYILATHADADHIDGLSDVARNFSVGAALVARTPRQDQEYRRFAATLSARQIPTRLIGSGDVLRFGKVTATVLWPAPSANTDAPSGNNDSIVLRLQFGQRALLLTGDVEMAGERRILQQGEDLGVDIVKVAHHGSKTSSTESFVVASRARFAVISVGQTSIFGHPNADVVKRWRDSGAQVETTGNSGTITISTNGRDLSVERFVDQREQ